VNQVPCKICEKKRAKRHCPGVGGEICPACCGNERENTIDCPLDCPYLLEAREHERPDQIPPADLPNADIRLTEQFIREHEPLIVWLSVALVRAMEKARAVDRDAREALDAMVRTYRTLDSGLIYETRPQNPYAAELQEALNKSISEFRETMAKESGLRLAGDKDMLGCLAFLQRMELDHENGRKRGRSFMQFLAGWFPQNKPAVAL
jgi:hypothetical protein